MKKWAQVPSMRIAGDLADYLENHYKGYKKFPHLPKIWNGQDLRDFLENIGIKFRVYPSEYAVVGLRKEWLDRRGCVFGVQTVLRHESPDEALVRCACGKTYIRSFSQLWHTHSCGCCSNPKASRFSHEMKLRRKKNLSGYLLELVRKQAKVRRGDVECTITAEDLPVPEFCPIAPVRIETNTQQRTDASPTVVRIDRGRGYVPGNVMVVSYEGKKTLDERQRVAEAEAIFTGTLVDDRTPEFNYSRLETLEQADFGLFREDFRETVREVEAFLHAPPQEYALCAWHYDPVY